jgi:hypothetical protein
VLCDQRTKPEFTAEQQAECRRCKYISGKKMWCCLFGCFIDGRPESRRQKTEDRRQKILRPKLIRPQTADRRLQTINPRAKITEADYKRFMANNENRFRQQYKVALTFYEKSTEAIIDEDTFVKRRQICAQCPPIDKSGCGCAGCKQWQKLVLKSLKCPKRKW